METPPNNFLGIPPPYSSFEQARCVLLPIPFDGTSTFMKGANNGPAALIKASQQVELYDIETDSEPYQVGVFTAPPVLGDTGISVNREAERRVSEYLKADKFVLSIGGEHSISLGPVRAHAAKFKKLSILQLDAHTDLRQEYHGDPLNHACIMARCLEIVPTIVQVGIRSLEKAERSRNVPERIFFAEKMVLDSNWIERAVSLLSEEVYLSIDLDVFDPSLMPSTGTPEPGGLGWYEVLRLIRRVAETRRIVGADIVELCPSANQGPDFIAAKLAYKVLNYALGTSRR